MGTTTETAEKLDATFLLRMLPSQKMRLGEAAKLRGIGAAEYVRQAIDDKLQLGGAATG